MPRITFHLLLCVLGVALAHTALAQSSRVALVMGNNAYESFAPLKQARGDADRVALTLESLPVPFLVTRQADSDRLEMRRAVEAFSNRLAQGTGEVALVYYAGHAISHNGDVWLLPVDAEIQVPGDVEAVGWSLRWLSGKLKQGNWKATVVVLDACRNALFADGQEPQGLRGEALPRGLIPIPQIKGMMIAYATAPGEVAREDTVQGGYYTQRLIRNLRTPGLTLQDVFNATALEVERQTRQRPELLMTAIEAIYLAGRSEPGFSHTLQQMNDSASSAMTGSSRVLLKPAILHFDVTPRFVSRGKRVEVTWQVKSAEHCNLEGPGLESVVVDPVSGSRDVTIRRSGSITIECGSEGGSVTAGEEVKVRSSSERKDSSGMARYCCDPTSGLKVCPLAAPGTVGVACTCPAVYGVGKMCH